MSDSVNYLVVHKSDTDVRAAVLGLLVDALSELEATPPDPAALDGFVQVTYTRRRRDSLCISGVTVYLNVAEDQSAKLIYQLSSALVDGADVGIDHAVKLVDPELRRERQRYADELFEIEMRLREVLSIIFIDSRSEDYYQLLADLDVRPQGREGYDASYLRQHCENQFFFLLFSDYPNINSRKKPSVERLAMEIARAADFDALQQSLRSPIEAEPYTGFLASLRDRMDPIERLRNCVAHNRAIPRALVGDYETAKSALLEEIDRFIQAIRKSEGN